MKNLIDYIWNCSPGEAVIIIAAGVWMAAWLVDIFVESFKK